MRMLSPPPAFELLTIDHTMPQGWGIAVLVGDCVAVAVPVAVPVPVGFAVGGVPVTVRVDVPKQGSL